MCMSEGVSERDVSLSQKLREGMRISRDRDIDIEIKIGKEGN